MSVKQYSITKRSGEYDPMTAITVITPAECTLCANYSFKGEGVHPDLFVKLDFEIAVDQHNNARDRTFEGVPNFGCSPVPAGQPRPYLVNLWPNFAK